MGTEQLLAVVKGTAGSGKSHVIKAMESVCEVIHPGCTLVTSEGIPSSGSVCVAAPTGTAAFNVHGRTLHSLFNLPHDEKTEFVPLTGKSKQRAEERLRCVPRSLL